MDAPSAQHIAVSLWLTVWFCLSAQGLSPLLFFASAGEPQAHRQVLRRGLTSLTFPRTNPANSSGNKCFDLMGQLAS
jgi:hypothetical protein